MLCVQETHLLDLRHHGFVFAQRVHDVLERRGPVRDGLGVHGRRGGGVGVELGGLLEVLEARVWRGEWGGGLLGRGLGEDAEDAGDVGVHGGGYCMEGVIWGVLYGGCYMEGGGLYGVPRRRESIRNLGRDCTAEYHNTGEPIRVSQGGYQNTGLE